MSADRTVHASRQTSGSSSATSIGPEYEHRHITWAFGLEFNNHQVSSRWQHPRYFQSRLNADDLILDPDDPNHWEYINHDQWVHFHITMTNRKDDFIAALQDPGRHVIYDGHARWGRGPCFGPDPAPGEDWQDSTAANRATRGIFPMGYKYLPVTTGEIHEHGYTPHLVTGDKPARDDCHPDIKARYSRLRTFTLAQLGLTVRGMDATDEVWGYSGYDEGRPAKHVILAAGWSATPLSPADLGGVSMSCRCFCPFGCSTFLPNYRILRFHKLWQRDGDDKFAYWTTAASTTGTSQLWLYYLLTYNRRNDFDPWDPSIRYAVRRTNQRLASMNESYRII